MVRENSYGDSQRIVSGFFRQVAPELRKPQNLRNCGRGGSRRIWPVGRFVWRIGLVPEEAVGAMQLHPAVQKAQF